MSLNANLRRAKRKRNDEFYTQLPDIEKELRNYSRHFRGKVVYARHRRQLALQEPLGLPKRQDPLVGMPFAVEPKPHRRRRR